MAGLAVLRWVVIGRPTGFRARVRRRMGLGALFGDELPPHGATGASVPGGSAAQARQRATGEPVPPPVVPEPPRSVTPPEGFEVVLHREALAPGELVEIILGGTAVALANVDGSFYALRGQCPHAGGPLGDGSLDGSTLTCPYHGWTFDVTTGRCHVDENVTVPRVEVAVVDDAVCLRL